MEWNRLTRFPDGVAGTVLRSGDHSAGDLSLAAHGSTNSRKKPSPILRPIKRSNNSLRIVVVHISEPDMLGLSPPGLGDRGRHRASQRAKDALKIRTSGV